MGAAAGAIAAVLPASAAAFSPGCEVSGGTETCTYLSGVNQFIVPAGVTQISVLAAGGSGGAGASDGLAPGGAGGRGALVSTPLSVGPGETLYADVGGSGAGGNRAGRTPGGSNGGGGSGSETAGVGGGGGGGGASDIRLSAGDLTTRLLVAGGGGGGGFGGSVGGGSGGDAGAGGGGTSLGASGGGPGTQTSGGAGGEFGLGFFPSVGQDGSLGQGGDGDVEAGGGGGGLYGGGGGANDGNDGSGGGGGSSLVPFGGSLTLDSTAAPRIVITLALPSTPVDVPPSADLVPDGSLNGGAPYALKLDGSASLDPEHASDSSSGIAAWKVKWGDGTASSTGTGDVPSSLPHTYAHPGTFLTTLTVTEGDGSASDSASVIVTVTKAPSALTAAPGTVHTISRTVSMSATLKRTDTNTPLSGRTVFFGTNSALVCAAVTNASGVAACTGPLTGSATTALANGYVATFAGDADTQSSSAAGRLTAVANSRDIPGTGARFRMPRAARASTLRVLRGTAAAGTQVVGLSLVREGAGRCSELMPTGALLATRTVRGWCVPTRLVRASGTRHWTLRLRRQLKAGRYQLYVWTLDRAGHVRVSATRFTLG
jgi:hypothetical protein